jgi:anti-sigma B factor antagonist
VLFDLADSDRDGWVVLAVTGELDVATAPRLRQEAVRIVSGRAADSSGPTKMVIDLSGVDFLDSTGLGVIIGVLKRVRSHGGELVLAGLTPQVEKVFEITRVSEIVRIVASVDEAVRPDDG